MTKNKHDHTATKKIKAWLFAIMLLLPFLFLLPTGLYYGLNQNAQLSERTEQQPVYYQTNEVVDENDLVIGNVYHWDDNYTPTYIPTVNKVLFNLVKTPNLAQYIGNYDFETSKDYTLLLGANNGNFILYMREADNTSHTYNLNGKIIDFVILNYGTSFSDVSYCISHISSSEAMFIKEYTSVVYNNDISTSIINAWNSTWQNPLFSWTSYSPFYAPMQSFTNVFGINDMQIANVLTYLATITAIYIVFDIVIELFTYLTHLIPRSD